ncbi:unnamed protein product [Boreogadus saida]
MEVKCSKCTDLFGAGVNTPAGAAAPGDGRVEAYMLSGGCCFWCCMRHHPHGAPSPPLQSGGASAQPAAKAVVPRRSPLPRQWCLGAARCQGSGASAAGSGAPAGDNRDQQSRATIPLASMSRFSLLQIDVDVEEPETTENPTQSFEIPIIVWRRTQLLAVIV